MVFDEKIHRAFRTHTTLATKLIRDIFHFHCLPKLYIRFKIVVFRNDSMDQTGLFCIFSQYALLTLQQEPSLFAVAKLLETGLVNLPRMEVLWRPLTAHMLDVCQHPNSKMREWGAEALTSLIKAALAYKHKPPLHENLVRTLLLSFQLHQIYYLLGVNFFLNTFDRE